MTQILFNQWQRIVKQWCADDQLIADVFQLLVTTYSDVNRHYHGLGHIQQMLELAEQYQEQINDRDGFFFAIWFHDFIQQRGGNNEELSAALAREYLQQLNVPEPVILHCERMILATMDHACYPDSDTRLFVDIDLSILAAERAVYKSYAYQCRKEYFLPYFVYRFGRRRFLKELLSRRFIFSSEVFRNQFEAMARGNIQWELEEWV